MNYFFTSLKQAVIGTLVIAMYFFAGCDASSDSTANTSADTNKPETNDRQSDNTESSSSQKTSLQKVSLRKDSSDNPVAYIPPQCYTNPVSDDAIHNPCYVCHTNSKAPNYLNDIDVQLEYSAPTEGAKNFWTNLFLDRTEQVAALSDEAMIRYIRQSNYLSENNEIILAQKLKTLPDHWDRNANGKWDGYTPDVYFNFNEDGFDQDHKGQLTGWRVFAYYPFPGTFMPTNGSTDDVLIRLPESFQQDIKGNYSADIYKLNLAIAEAIMKAKTVTIAKTDEKLYGVDLNKDGTLGETTQVVFEWEPLKNKDMSYVGMAKDLQAQGKIKLAKHLLPVGTEFIHSVRYVDFDGDQPILSARMKELRYSRKSAWRNYHQLGMIVDEEIKERHDFPDRTKTVQGNAEEGLRVNQGWTYQGFIEDQDGELRPQTYEETYFCAGCHGGVGASNDTVFALPRKLDSTHPNEGWYHWSKRSLSNIADPKRTDGNGEYAFYLTHNPTGNEYRNNLEVLKKFYHDDGKPNVAAFENLENDITVLLNPSKERAMMLNKAYKVIVEEQSYALGREPHVKPLTNVKKNIELNGPTGIKTPLSAY